MSPMYAHQIFIDYNLYFLSDSYFGTFSLICNPDSHRDFILHVAMYLLFAYIHIRNNYTVAYFLEIMNIFLKFIYSLLLI